MYCQVLSFCVCYFCSFSYSTKGGTNDSCPTILNLTPPPTLSWLWCCHVESPLLVLFGLYSGLGSATRILCAFTERIFLSPHGLGCELEVWLCVIKFLLFYGSVQRAWNLKWDYSLEVTIKPPTVVLIVARLIRALLKLSPDAGITAGQKMASC